MKLLTLLVGSALATSIPTGVPIAGVSLEAPRGGLPEESLTALFRARQGQPYDPQHVRIDLTTLFRVGDFAAVEAHTEPWVMYDEDGNPQEAVQLIYRVYPAPRVSRVRVQGNTHFSTRKILDAAAVEPGQVFYPDLDAPRVRERVIRWYRRQGFINAEVEIDPQPITDGAHEVWIRIFEGRPNTLRAMRFVGPIPPSIGERRLRRWAHKAGMREGDPINQETIRRTQAALRARLASMDTLGSPRGWIQARITPAVHRDADGSVTVTWAVEPGPRLELVVNGLRWRARKTVREALGIDERLRLTRGFLDEADDRVEAALARRGFFEATATVELRTGDPHIQTLLVEIERGPRHTLRGVPPRSSLVFRGNRALTASALTRVVDQASPDQIRLDYFTHDALAKGLEAIRAVYRSRGFPHARLRLVELLDRPRFHPLIRRLWSAVLHRPAPHRLVPIIEVEEGPQVHLREATITGAAPEIPTADLVARLGAMEGRPLDPPALGAVERTLLERHRQRGYLQAQVQLRQLPSGEDGARVVLDVQPGPLLLLRSVLVRGLRLTRPRFIHRELAFTRGAPLSSTALETTRRHLYDLGIFDTVHTALLGEGPARDLLVHVQERKRWAAEVGGGVNTDQGARLLARLTRYNLFGLAHRLEAYGLIGVDYLSDSVTDWRPDLYNVEWRGALSYTAPHAPYRNNDLVFDLLLQERRQERTWRMARTGIGATLDTAIGAHTSLQTTVRTEIRHLQEVDIRALLPGEPWATLTDRPSDARCHPCRSVTSLRAVLLHDRRDDPVFPQRGLLASGIGEWVPALNARHAAPFVKGSVRFAGFVPLGGPILFVGGEGGLTRSLGGAVVPLEDRFRLGGTGSMRGFRRWSVGPRNLAERVDPDWPAGLDPLLTIAGRTDRTRWVPTGGDTQAVLTTELLMPLPWLGLQGWEGYAGALFADVGNVWQLGPGDPTTKNLPDVPLLRYGVGVGLRIRTPVGPLQLDLASNVQAATATGPRRVMLVQDWAEPPLRAHLSLGTLW